MTDDDDKYPASLGSDGLKVPRAYRSLERIAKMRLDNRAALDAMHARLRRPTRVIRSPRIEHVEDPIQRPGEVSLSVAASLLGRSSQTVRQLIQTGRLAARSVPWRSHVKRHAKTRGAIDARARRARRRPATSRRRYYVRCADVLALRTERRLGGFRRVGITAAQVYALRLEGHSIADIACSLGVSVRTVSRRLEEWFG